MSSLLAPVTGSPNDERTLIERSRAVIHAEYASTMDQQAQRQAAEQAAGQGGGQTPAAQQDMLAGAPLQQQRTPPSAAATPPHAAIAPLERLRGVIDSLGFVRHVEAVTDAVRAAGFAPQPRIRRSAREVTWQLPADGGMSRSSGDGSSSAAGRDSGVQSGPALGSAAFTPATTTTTVNASVLGGRTPGPATAQSMRAGGVTPGVPASQSSGAASRGSGRIGDGTSRANRSPRRPAERVPRVCWWLQVEVTNRGRPVQTDTRRLFAPYERTVQETLAPTLLVPAAAVNSGSASSPTQSSSGEQLHPQQQPSLPPPPAPRLRGSAVAKLLPVIRQPSPRGRGVAAFANEGSASALAPPANGAVAFSLGAAAAPSASANGAGAAQTAVALQAAAAAPPAVPPSVGTPGRSRLGAAAPSPRQQTPGTNAATSGGPTPRFPSTPLTATAATAMPGAVESLGLGLPIARLFAMELDGRVGLFSEPAIPPVVAPGEHVTCFVLQLPLVRDFRCIRRTWGELLQGRMPSPPPGASGAPAGVRMPTDPAGLSAAGSGPRSSSLRHYATRLTGTVADGAATAHTWRSPPASMPQGSGAGASSSSGGASISSVTPPDESTGGLRKLQARLRRKRDGAAAASAAAAAVAADAGTGVGGIGTISAGSAAHIAADASVAAPASATAGAAVSADLFRTSVPVRPAAERAVGGPLFTVHERRSGDSRSSDTGRAHRDSSGSASTTSASGSRSGTEGVLFAVEVITRPPLPPMLRPPQDEAPTSAAVATRARALPSTLPAAASTSPEPSARVTAFQRRDPTAGATAGGWSASQDARQPGARAASSLTAAALASAAVASSASATAASVVAPTGVASPAALRDAETERALSVTSSGGTGETPQLQPYGAATAQLPRWDVSAASPAGGAGGGGTVALAAMAPSPVAPTSPRTPPRVLVVDDEPVIRRIHARYLTRLGFEVESVEDGDLCLSTVEAAEDAGRPFSAILLDIVMRRVHGDQACRDLRAAGFRLPVVAATGNAGPRDVERLVSLGFDAVLEKPFSIAQLSAVLQSCGVSSEPRSPLVEL